MAREHARLLTRIWSDEDWRARSMAAQWLYKLLLSQATINNAGVLPLQPSKWSRGAADVTLPVVEAALEELAAARFVVVDRDTEEVLVRSFVRNDGVAKIPNVLKSALRQAEQIESPKLRTALAAELRRLTATAAWRTAEALDPQPVDDRPQGPVNPSPNGSGDGSPNSQTAVDNYPEGTISGTRREPIPEPQGVGEGERGKGTGSSVDGSLGGHAHTREPAREDTPPPPRCPKHLDAPTDAPCGPCGDARRARQAWDADASRRAAQARSSDARAAAEARALAIARCQLCDADGYAGRVLCDHDPDSAARAARGAAAARAALPKREPRPAADDRPALDRLAELQPARRAPSTTPTPSAEDPPP